MKKLALLAITTAFFVAACGAPQKHNKADADSAIAAAEFANKKAKKAGYQWRDAGKLMKKAKAAAKDGNFDKAVKLANKAKAQGEDAYAQYKYNEKKAPWKAFGYK